jgi:hypothetical protein
MSDVAADPVSLTVPSATPKSARCDCGIAPVCECSDEIRPLAVALKGVRVHCSCSGNEMQLLRECYRLIPLPELLKLFAWLKASGEVINVDFLVAFCRFWHELIISDLDTEALLNFALNWHLAASARGYTKSKASRYWLTIRALEELGMLDPVSASGGKRKEKRK